jgi:hypothetical protein
MSAASAARLVLHTPIYSPQTLRAAFKRQVAAFTAGPVFWAVDRLRRNRVVSDLYKRFLVEGPGVDPYDAQVNFDNQLRADARAARDWLRDGITRDYRGFLKGWHSSWWRPTIAPSTSVRSATCAI